MMGFELIFWGFLAAIVNVNLGGVKVPPNFVCYLMIYTGLKRLGELSGYFQKARKICLPVAIVSIVDIYQIKVETATISWILNVILSPFGKIVRMNLVFVFDVVVTAFVVLMVYYLCMGIAEVGDKFGNPKLASTARQRWKSVFVGSICMAMAMIADMVYISIHQTLSIGLVLMLMPAMIVGVVSFILFLGLLRQAMRFEAEVGKGDEKVNSE